MQILTQDLQGKRLFQTERERANIRGARNGGGGGRGGHGGGGEREPQTGALLDSRVGIAWQHSLRSKLGTKLWYIRYDIVNIFGTEASLGSAQEPWPN